MPAADLTLLDQPAPAPAQVAMATFDAALVCTYANARFAEVAGLDVDDVRGLHWTTLFPGLTAGQQALVRGVAVDGAAVAEVDVTTTATGRPSAPPVARQRWRLVLHRVEGVTGAASGRVVSVLGTLATGPAVLDPPAFRHRLADTLRSGAGASGVLLVDLGPEPDSGLTGRAAALRGAIRATDVVSVDVDEATGRSFLALLCPELPAPWTAAVIGDRLRRTTKVAQGRDDAEAPQVSVTVARPRESAESLLRRASASLLTELHLPGRALPDGLPLEAPPLRTSVRQHEVAAGRAVVVRLTGEADLSTLRGLVRLLEAIVEDRPAALVIDAAQLTFCDVATVRALVAGTERAARAGALVGIAGMPPTMSRVFRLGWSGSHLRRWVSVEAALAGLTSFSSPTGWGRPTQ